MFCSIREEIDSENDFLSYKFEESSVLQTNSPQDSVSLENFRKKGTVLL